MSGIKLDLNNPIFQQQWFTLPSEETGRVVATLYKLSRMTWNQLYADRGIRWEAVESTSGPRAQRTYSLRVTRKMRALAWRDGETMRLLSLHPDHDSAYH